MNMNLLWKEGFVKSILILNMFPGLKSYIQNSPISIWRIRKQKENNDTDEIKAFRIKYKGGQPLYFLCHIYSSKPFTSVI